MAAAGLRLRAFLTEAAALARRGPDVTGGALGGDIERAVSAFQARLAAALALPALEARFASPWPRPARTLLSGERDALGAILGWAALEALGRLSDPSHVGAAAARLFDALRIRPVLADALARLGLHGDESWRAAARVRVALAHAGLGAEERAGGRAAAARLAR